ncbi:MAG: RNase H family protein [Chitinophagaceae bacterium]
MPEIFAEVYTDGSCHTQLKAGVWVAIIFIGNEKKILSATVTDTTHNRMELTAVIKSIQFLKTQYRFITTIRIITDSQYVTGLPARKEKIVLSDFTTAKENLMQNADLVKTFLQLLSSISVEFIKIKAHQKKTDIINYNREADILSRKLLRKAVEQNID